MAQVLTARSSSSCAGVAQAVLSKTCTHQQPRPFCASSLLRCLAQSNNLSRSCGRSRCSRRGIQTLSSNPHIYVHAHPSSSSSSSSAAATVTATEASAVKGVSILSYLPRISMATLGLSIASTTSIPPTPASTRENAAFMEILREVISQHAVHDPAVISQAQQFASTGGAGHVFLASPSRPRPRPRVRLPPEQQAHEGKQSSSSSSSSSETATATAAAAAAVQEGASGQGGSGGAGVGGWIHVADTRNPPDWGRIAYTEDILGSLQVDRAGAFVGADGNFQWSGAYRLVTNQGILGLSAYLRERLLERLLALERDLASNQ